MISAADVRHALTGAVRLARGEREGAAHFDDTPQDFWRSFWAAAFVAPIWLVLVSLVSHDTEASPLRIILAQAAEYALMWTAFPLVLYEILHHSGGDEHFCRYIAAHNWGAVLVAPALLIAFVVATAVPLDAAGVLPLLVMISSVVYEWFIARSTLAVSGSVAAGIAALDFFLGQMIALSVDALLAATPAIDGFAQP